MSALDPEAVEAFVLTADLHSFTLAAVSLDTTQAAVSQKIKRLEGRLGRRLLDRTPRRVKLSKDGEAFLDAAREFVRSYKQALSAFDRQRVRLVVGVTHHLVGPDLPFALKRITDREQHLTLDLRIGDTQALLDLLDAGKLDAAIALRHGPSRRRSCHLLYSERFSWFASRDFDPSERRPLPLAMQPAPCHVREMTLAALAKTKLEWREAIVGGGAIAVGAAAVSGIAVAVMGRTAKPAGVVDVTRRFSLPALGERDVVLYANATSSAQTKLLQSLARALLTGAGPLKDQPRW